LLTATVTENTLQSLGTHIEQGPTSAFESSNKHK